MHYGTTVYFYIIWMKNKTHECANPVWGDQEHHDVVAGGAFVCDETKIKHTNTVTEEQNVVG